MRFFNSEEKVILAGSKIAEWDEMVSMYSSRYKIDGIIDFDLRKPGKVEIGNTKIILIGNEWKEDAEKLEGMGLTAWKNFFPEWAYSLIKNKVSFKYNDVKNFAKNCNNSMGQIFKYIAKYKKIACVYGNCQSLFIAKMLEKTEKIKDEYIFCEMPFIQEMFYEAKHGLSEKYLHYITLFIYQNVGPDNIMGEKLATENGVLTMLAPNCIKVSVPFVYFNAYFPQYIKNIRNDRENHTPYGDSKIQELCEAGKGMGEIIKELNSRELFSKADIQKNLDITISELQKRESKCDIHILDYILTHYKEEYLFYSPSHPTNQCLHQLVKRILDYLGYKNCETDLSDVPENNMVEMFIYPCVYQTLQLKFNKKKFCFHRSYMTEDSIEEYVEKYVEHNFPEFSVKISDKFRTINLSHLLEINETLVSKRKETLLTLNGCILHIGAYLTVESEHFKGAIFRVPKAYAPQYGYATMISQAPSGRTLPVFVNNQGEFIINGSFAKGSALILDTTWCLRGGGKRRFSTVFCISSIQYSLLLLSDK